MTDETREALTTIAKGYRIMAEGLEKLLAGEDDDDELDEEEEEAPRRKPKKSPKKKPVGRRRPKKAPEPEEDEDEPEEEDEDEVDEEVSVDTMGRPHLKRYIKQKKLDIDPTGMKLAELREAIKEAEGGGSKKKAKGRKSKKVELSVLQDTLSEVIENHWDDLEDSIEALGCGADCYDCPHPEEDSAEDQIKSCLRSVAEELDIEYDSEVADAIG